MIVFISPQSGNNVPKFKSFTAITLWSLHISKYLIYDNSSPWWSFRGRIRANVVPVVCQTAVRTHGNGVPVVKKSSALKLKFADCCALKMLLVHSAKFQILKISGVGLIHRTLFVGASTP